MSFQSEAAGSGLYIPRELLGDRDIIRVNEQSNRCRFGNKLVQQFQPLRPYLGVQRTYACQVTARSTEARHESGFNRISGREKYNRDNRGRLFGGITAGVFTAMTAVSRATRSAPSQTIDRIG